MQTEAGCGQRDEPRDARTPTECQRATVLILGSFVAPLPLERYVSGDLAQRLSAAGWSAITSSRRVNRLARFLDMAATAYRASYDLALVDVFSGPAFMGAEAICYLLRSLDKPVVLTLHGGNLPDFSRRWPRRARRLLRSASVVTTPSRYLQEAMRPFRPEMRLIPNPIDLKPFPFRLRSNPAPKVIWLRAFHEIYNPCLAVEALSHLCDRSSAFSLQPSAFGLIMYGPDKGDGSLRKLKAEIGKLRLDQKVRLAGPVDKGDVPRVLSDGDVFLNTTNIDNTPVSVIEAMACGLCVVSTNVGGIPYLLEHETDSLLVPPNDAGAMAHAVRRILTEPGLSERLSGNARAKAERFDWSLILPKWEKLLIEVTHSASTRAAGR